MNINLMKILPLFALKYFTFTYLFIIFILLLNSAFIFNNAN